MYGPASVSKAIGGAAGGGGGSNGAALRKSWLILATIERKKALRRSSISINFTLGFSEERASNLLHLKE